MPVRMLRLSDWQAPPGGPGLLRVKAQAHLKRLQRSLRIFASPFADSKIILADCHYPSLVCQYFRNVFP